MSTASLGMCKLGYLRVSSTILKRNFYESAQINGVEQHSEQSRKPSSQQWILKKAERCIHHCYIMSDRLSNLLTEAFLGGYTSLHMSDMISISIHKAVYTYHQAFCCLKNGNTK